jgi:hypothetical protein
MFAVTSRCEIGNIPTLDDHTDPDYDASVRSRLIRIDTSAQRVRSDLTSRLLRFDLHATRLSAALERPIGSQTAT